MITILETGTALLAADGEWNDPNYARQHKGAAFFIRVPDCSIPAISELKLRAGEYDVLEDSVLPQEFVAKVREHYKRTDRIEHPWNY